jgi:hypothetical protein
VRLKVEAVQMAGLDRHENVKPEHPTPAAQNGAGSVGSRPTRTSAIATARSRAGGREDFERDVRRRAKSGRVGLARRASA